MRRLVFLAPFILMIILSLSTLVKQCPLEFAHPPSGQVAGDVQR